MHQFMCHKFLTFTFGPQINFIIGARALTPDLSSFTEVPQVTTEVRTLDASQNASPTPFAPGGKSAVLSAITVALGGKANSTGRGNGLKSFIREGQSYAGLDFIASPLS